MPYRKRFSKGQRLLTWLREASILAIAAIAFFLLGYQIFPQRPAVYLPPPTLFRPGNTGLTQPLTTSFGPVPLKLQVPTDGIDLTENTLHDWLGPNSHEVFLTFDDGPSPQATGHILDILKEHNIKATFFVLGRNVINYPEIVQRIVAEGHELALHSNTHLNMAEIATTQKIAEIADALSAIHWQLPHLRIRWFRPPYGRYDAEIRQIAHAHGMCLALFTKLTTDANSSAEQIAQAILAGRGQILVLHDGQWPRTDLITAGEVRLIEGLSAALPALKAQGVEFKTLSNHFGYFCP